MKIKRFKLNNLSANEHRQKEMNAIIGGRDLVDAAVLTQELVARTLVITCKQTITTTIVPVIHVTSLKRMNMEIG